MGETVTRNSALRIDPTAQIAPTAVIGSPFRPLLGGRRMQPVSRETAIGAGVWIGQFAVIGQGVTIGADSLIEDQVNVQQGAAVGRRVVVASPSWIGLDVKVGDDSVIRGYVGDSCRIGSGCRITGDLIHRQIDPSAGWDDTGSEEPAPIVENGAFVGWKATVIGGVNIGIGAYVCAGALVTVDVPAGHIACGRNEIVHPDQWKGALGKSPFFHQTHGRTSGSGD
jgi:UDP-3-O-[3-hydroxymyristoyl] glucosamine N-acyltransferase